MSRISFAVIEPAAPAGRSSMVMDMARCGAACAQIDRATHNSKTQLKTEDDFFTSSLHLRCAEDYSRVLPRSTFTDAFGKTKVVCESASIVRATGGSSGSAWLFGPSLIHTYCSLPKVANVTGPSNPDSCFAFASLNMTRTVWGLFSSRLTSIRDQFPSGRRTA